MPVYAVPHQCMMHERRMVLLKVLKSLNFCKSQGRFSHMDSERMEGTWTPKYKNAPNWAACDIVRACVKFNSNPVTQAYCFVNCIGMGSLRRMVSTCYVKVI